MKQDIEYSIPSSCVVRNPSDLFHKQAQGGGVEDLRRISSIKKRKFYSFASTDSNGCWVWETLENKNRYQGYILNGKQFSAHRLSWQINFGPIPKGLYVCHTCDNKRCINPSHLFLGTPKDNTQDMIKKGRALHMFGESCRLSKLKEKDVYEILHSSDSSMALSKKYSVTTRAIHHIRSGRNWKQMHSTIKGAK